MQNQPERIGRGPLPEGLPAALVGAALLIASFVGFTLSAPLSSVERWAALTTFAVLALAVTLLGSAPLADVLGRTIRRDWRAYATLLAFIPVLYLACAGAVRLLTFGGLLRALVLTVLPALALWRAREARGLTLLDAVGLGYLWLVGAFNLWPDLALPVAGERVGFFTLAAMPLLIVLLAARGWPGLGYTWHLSGADLRSSLLGSLIGLALVAPARLAAGAGAFGGTGVLPLIGAAIEAYFFVALPITLFDRGVVQQGVTRALAAWPRLAPVVGIGVGAVLTGVRALSADPGAWALAAMAGAAAVGYGWVYWRTGKVTAAAVSQMLVVWAATPG